MPRNKKSSVKTSTEKPAKPPAPKSGKPKSSKPKASDLVVQDHPRELVILTGLSGAGKASALKAFEDMGFYSVDNMPMELIPRFADLVRQSVEIRRAAIVVDVREGQTLDRFPALLRDVRKILPTRVLFLDAADAMLLRRYSETRRPHPLGRSNSVVRALRAERKLLDPVRNLADINLDTTNFNVHELRASIQNKFERGHTEKDLLISCISFGFKNGVPLEADLVFDVRFLPNPHFVPEFRRLTGKHPKVAAYVRRFPQTDEFLRELPTCCCFFCLTTFRKGRVISPLHSDAPEVNIVR